MDLLNEFFDISKSFERVVVAGPQSGGRIHVNPDEMVVDPLAKRREAKGTSYAKEIQEAEERAWEEDFNTTEDDDHYSRRGGLHDIDDTLSSIGLVNDMEQSSKVYDTYDFSRRTPTNLPIEAFKENLVTAINNNTVVVVQGATGCGKTTQIPQYILENCRSRGAYCNIVVTQPRRLAAIAVAKHVCSERKWNVGGLVGYQVGLNPCSSPDTRLLFCTTGVLLQKLISAKSLQPYTHVILDEVHERDEDMDFTMMVVRKLLRQRPDTKVILMSATIDPDKYRQYFAMRNVQGDKVPAPLIDLDKDTKRRRTNYKVNVYYLDQLHTLLDPEPVIDYTEPGISPANFEVAFKLITKFDILEEKSCSAKRGAVLVFLPGLQEIEELYNLLMSKYLQYKWWVLPLHSTITTDEQEIVFKRTPAGHRKIILSTNIAESSLTVPDIAYVIDFCLTKQMICDPSTNFCSLQITWASKTNCIQRAGRTGRVCEGRVYRLVPFMFFEDVLPTDLSPEILRSPLDRTVLLTKLLDMGAPKYLLALCLDPPDLTNIESTILVLKEIGALLKTHRGNYNIEDGDLTYLGYVMAKLPVDIHVSKFIMLGNIFNVLDDCIVMAAALSLKSMFSSPFQERMAAYQCRLTWADGSCSDCIAFLNAYKVWRNRLEGGLFDRQGLNEEAWAKRYFLQLSTLREIAALVKEITSRLESLGIKDKRDENRSGWSEQEKFMVWRFVMAGAFYPNYFVRSAQGGQVDEKTAVRQVVGRDPLNTVFLQGVPMDQPGELYTKAIKSALKICGADMRIGFDGTSKVYVQFARPSRIEEFNLVGDIPGKVGLPIYKAVKLRQLRIPISLKIMDPHKAIERAVKLGVKSSVLSSTLEFGKDNGFTLKPILPSVDTSCIYVFITYVVDPGCFYAHITQTAEARAAGGRDEQDFVHSKLNNNPAKNLTRLTRPPVVGNVYAVPFQRKEKPSAYRRALIQSVNPGKENSVCQVFLIDYGMTLKNIDVTEVRNFGKELKEAGILTIPPQAFECALSELRPSILMNQRGGWCEEAKSALLDVKMNGKVYGQVYSVTHGIVHLEIYGERQLPFEDAKPLESVNQYFIRKGWAEYAEESYQSRTNHEMRLNASSLRMEVNAQNVLEDLQHEYGRLWLQSRPDPELPKDSDCVKWISLKGPFSPLEMRVFALSHIGVSREVHIDWSSVNSVLLDTSPQDPHERMLISAHVGENADHNRLSLRNTSLLPNIHGLSSLICMLFAPTIELRVNPERNKFTGALCGLGYDSVTGDSYFPDHDMEVTFDTKITIDDLQDINRLRFWMSQSFMTDSEYDFASTGNVNLVYCQGKLMEFLRKLLRAPRPSQEVFLSPRAYLWKQMDPQYLLSPGCFDEMQSAIYPLHFGVELVEDEEDYSDHIIMLHKISTRQLPMMEGLECKLCNIPINDERILRMHLYTQQHREKEMYIMPDITKQQL